MKRTPLKRRTPLRQTGTDIPRKRTRMRQVSDKRRKRDQEYPAARDYVMTRSRGFCEARIHADGCSQKVEQVHHIAGRGGDNPHHPDNLLGVSSQCHALIHAEPGRSYRLGLMRSRLEGDA